MPARPAYLLGDTARESARLRAQARLWDPVSHALFDRLRIRRGARILEIGPGQGSLHLELRKRAGCAIDAVERSPVFFERLRRICARDGLGEGRIWNRELLDAPLPPEHYDLIFARWVFLFLPNPVRHLKKLARSLRPGGRLVLQDYHRETLAMIPRPRWWDELLEADRRFFSEAGGDASIAGRIHGYLARAGLETETLTPQLRTGHPGSPTWRWLTDYFLPILPRYARHPPLTAAKARALAADWRKAERIPTSLLIAPTVVDVIARKRG